MTMIPRTPPRIARGASAMLSRAKGSFSSPPASGRRGSSSTTATNNTKEANHKSPAVSFANDENHTQSNGGTGGGGTGGGTGDNTTEIIGDAPVHSGNTLENYVLPKSLRMDVVDEYANGGMEVIKVSKNGKQQTRRLGIAPNNRAIYITSHKHLPQSGRVLGLLKQVAGAGASDEQGGGVVKEVDLSRVVRMQLGQQSRRFVKARSKQYVVDSLTNTTPQSLSIIYRRSSSDSTKDKFVKSMQKNKGVATVIDAGEDSLDLIIPSKDDFEALTRTLDDLLSFYTEEEPCANPDYALIQYHLVDMGKSLVVGQGQENSPCLVSCSDWVTLCKRWNAPVTKGEATAMYRAFCDSLAISNTQSEGGLELFEVVRLLEVLRQRGLEVASVEEEPRKYIFNQIAQNTGKSDNSRAISAMTFLQFLHEKQKETNVTLEDVKDLFYQLNGHRVTSQLDDTMSEITGQQSIHMEWEREYITWEAFGRYLLLESNDVFDPERAKLSDSYMNEPLNNYWINTSHDTYLRRTTASGTDSGKTDLQSYTLALYRGARAIELDVWDGSTDGEPVVRFGVSSFSEHGGDKSSVVDSLSFADVILTISFFLQSEPDSYPIILLIENHCSLPFQERMASHLKEILGKKNLLYVPDQQGTGGCSLPSPLQLRGKVLIKSKLPEKMNGEVLVLNDDYDDENRDSVTPIDADYDSEDDLKENVIGFSTTGSIKSPLPDQKRTAEQLFQTARSESIDATFASRAAYNELHDAKHRAQLSQNHADALLRDINMTYDELKKKRQEEIENMPDEGTEVELCVDGVGKVKEPADHAVEIAIAFAESVEESHLLAIAAATYAKSELELFEIAREDITEKEAVLEEAKEQLRNATESNRDLLEAAERALSEARSNREYAENAERRVIAVRGLLDRSHNQAVSSETVAGTADAEAKISEQRASEAEARAKKARANAENDRIKAEKETKLEDDIEAQLIEAHDKLKISRAAVTAAQERANDAVAQADKLANEMREAKGVDHDDEQSLAESITVADQKRKERKMLMGQMERALTDKLGLETNTRKVENRIEDLQRKANLQAKVAASARKQADHSMSVAYQLEEHALEEREAANLRLAARLNAKRGVESSDAVLTSTETQLAEAEKAAADARALALASRQKAEQLSKEAETLQDVTPLEENVRLAQEIRDEASLVYERAKESKDEALEKAAKAKQVHETNCVNLANLERDAMAELLLKESVQQAELLAITACENAIVLRNQVEVLTKAHAQAIELAVSKSDALKLATRYKEKRRRAQSVSSTLAELTTLHSSRHRNWDKSFHLPSNAMHSIPIAKVVEQAEKGKQEWKRWVEFNRTHLIRTYPESASRNYNPVLPWALGCQFVSINFLRNKFMLLNDGRFRENGGQGYVLKPEYLCNASEDTRQIESPLNVIHPKQLSIRILSGCCLPRPSEKKSSSTANPFVKVTLYDASPAALLPSPVFRTRVVEGNGLNPVWVQDKVTFSCLAPSVAMLLFVVYDHCQVTKTDLFVGASAMPVSCIREGYRCVSLFDSNNARSGAMKHASLFIKVRIE